ncbi:MAG: IS200/IS605 family transposase [Flavobacteriaceae bacterium]|jgi:REP element-mobilizing transposase RayT|uniref:REP element-mobilizing transposase RayT n=2 Tax=Flavobacteriaceae TaxID=49546 RepID=A0A4Q0NV25_9FLAO|nr:MULTISPECIES: IS200/IS605 family transposase [Flavobacteriaceae]MBW8201235.1 IS200/IS605 family transposase [Allomuricauda abyssi]RXG14838.1 REP element-mobilizing transposase RayT [Leeuwenhoekiella polynyae]|tara:strand:+ start:5134 stop:5589 length:456 start_codon:yes stop_codon:yes gene_type:complete
MSDSKYIHKSHNVSVLLYHFVYPAKYRRVVFDKNVDQTLVKICMDIEKRYEVHFLEIGTDKDHVHFLLQSVPMKSPTQIVKILKSITAREIFQRHPEVKKVLWGGAFWSSGYFVNTVSKFRDESTISKYVRAQGMEKDYDVLHKVKQLTLF